MQGKGYHDYNVVIISYMAYEAWLFISLRIVAAYFSLYNMNELVLFKRVSVSELISILNNRSFTPETLIHII